MPLHWTAPRQAAFRDAYLDWSRLLSKRRDALPPMRPDAGVDYEPIFVRLNTGSDPEAARAALQVALDAGSGLAMDGHERARLAARRDTPDPYAGLPDEYALYRRVGTPDSDHAALFAVLDTGVPVHLDSDPAPVPSVGKAARHSGSLPPGTPIMAIIDDGVGFMNARFRKGGGTRFEAVWLQALENPGVEGGIVCGSVLERCDIDALASRPEAETYAALHRSQKGAESRPALSYSTSHGTHVFDLAAGADPDDATDPARDWPLLAVGLPSEAVDDTSGAWFESYMVQGLRWILDRARGIDPTAPVIVNLSLGVTAGPRDGSRFVEYQLAREAAQWEAWFGQPVRLVWSFGNSYRSALQARLSYPQAETRDDPEKSIDWRVQPEDETASFLELHTRGAPSTALTVSVTAPDGTCSGFDTLAPGEIRSLEQDGQALARLYHVPARDFGAGVQCPAHLVLAVAPTRWRKWGEPCAKAGCWQVGLQYGGSEAADVLVQVQRDDALAGSRLRGRQAYLDHPEAHGWTETEKSYTTPSETCPVTTEGSHNALVTADTRQTFCVGAARWTPVNAAMGADNVRPSFYTAEGAPWSVPGPVAATLVDHGAFAPGTRGAGTLSGSARRLGGTSAGAGLLSRALGLSAARIGANLGNEQSRREDDLDPAVLDLFDLPESMAPRLGSLLVCAVNGAALPPA